MNEAEETVLLIGFRGSGKTTFLAALWHLLEAHEIAAQLRTPTLQPDREYLNHLRRRWLELQPMERTGLRESHTISLYVEDVQSDRLLLIVVPDVSGEVFRIQWEEREVPSEYLEFERKSCGAVLFVHPECVTQSPRIPAETLAASEGAPVDLSPSEPVETEKAPMSGDKADRIQWQPNYAPFQVQLLDALQNYLAAVRARPAFLSVVVSAWDLLTDKVEINPETWLETRLPLVSQFLQARRDEISTYYCGVSAQGGDLERDRSQLSGFFKQSERAFVVEEGRRHTDLSVVVKWVLPK